jgi:tetratricopeptide (TPR) repeat protein
MKRSTALTICCTIAVALAMAVRFIFQSGASLEEQFQNAVVALEQGEVDSVRQSADTLIQSSTHVPHAHFLYGALFLRRGEYSKALQELELAAFHPELEVQVLVLGGQALYQSNRAFEAQQRWHRAIDISPNNVDAHRWLGVYYYDLGAMEDAVHHLERVSELALDDARVHRLLGVIHKDYGHFDEASKNYEESLRREPHPQDQDAVLLELAESLMELRKYDRAISFLERAEPTPEGLAMQAECHLNLGHLKFALARIDEAIHADPDSERALLTKGKILLESSHAQDAVTVLTRASDQHPKDYFIHFTLAQAHRLAGDSEAAGRVSQLAESLRVEWHEYSELNRQAIEDTANALLRYKLGLAAIQLDRSDLAVGWFRAALAINPNHSGSQAELNKLMPD